MAEVYASGDKARDGDVLEKACRRLQSLMATRGTVDKDCQEVARYTQESFSPYLFQTYDPATGNPSAQGVRVLNNTKLLDDEGIWAADTLANGMYSGMTSPASPWFKLGLEDTDLKEYGPVKLWLAEVEAKIYQFFAKTNFYAAQKSSYRELATFGTSATFMVEDWQHGGVAHSLEWGEYWIGLDAANIASTLARRVHMTCIQIVERFGRRLGMENLPRAVREAYQQGKYQQGFTTWHMVEPNNDRQGDKIDRTNMPWRSLEWMDGDNGKKLLAFDGYQDRPFWAPRWEVKGSQVYGRSPAMRALPNLRKLQLQELRLQQATDYAVRPPLAGPTALNNTHANLSPGGLTTMSMQDKDSFGPIWQVPYQAVDLISKNAEVTKGNVRRAFYADLFMAITNMPGIQPRNMEEIARRNEEKLSQLGPAVERNQNEQLKVAIDRAYGILERTGQLPPPPEELDGVEIKVEYTSTLSQLQRAISVSSIERGLSFVGNLAAINPEALDKIDFDQTVDEYSDRIGMPPSLIRSDDAVAAMRADRAKQQQAAATAAAAPAVKDGAQAAELLSRTDDGNGASLLARALGNA